MTIDEAIEDLKENDANHIAEWLEELKQYKEIENSDGRSFLTTDQVHDLCTEALIKGRADAERDFQNSDYWNDYLAKVIKDAKADAIEELTKGVLEELKECAEDWKYYFDEDNYSLVSTVLLKKAEQLKGAEE